MGVFIDGSLDHCANDAIAKQSTSSKIEIKRKKLFMGLNPSLYSLKETPFVREVMDTISFQFQNMLGSG